MDKRFELNKLWISEQLQNYSSLRKYLSEGFRSDLYPFSPGLVQDQCNPNADLIKAAQKSFRPGLVLVSGWAAVISVSVGSIQLLL